MRSTLRRLGGGIRDALGRPLALARSQQPERGQAELDWHGSAPCSHLGDGDTRKRERVRCSSLIDWPVYPRLRRIMQGSEWARNSGPLGCTRAAFLIPVVLAPIRG